MFKSARNKFGGAKVKEIVGIILDAVPRPY